MLLKHPLNKNLKSAHVFLRSPILQITLFKALYKVIKQSNQQKGKQIFMSKALSLSVNF